MSTTHRTGNSGESRGLGRRSLVLLAALVASASVCFAQSVGTYGPGVAVVKDKPFYENSLAQAFAFTSVQDRTASGYGAAGSYLFFRGGRPIASKQAQQVLYIFEPSELSAAGISSAAQAESTLARLRAAARLNPTVAAFLRPFIHNVEMARNSYSLGRRQGGEVSAP